MPNINIEDILNALDLFYDNENALYVHSDLIQVLNNHVFIDHRGKQRLIKNKVLIYFSPYVPNKNQGFFMKILNKAVADVKVFAKSEGTLVE